jgi:hypothetical protein
MPWVVAWALFSCGTDPSGPLNDGGTGRLAAGLEDDRAADTGVAARSPRAAGPTLADALRSVGQSSDDAPADPESSAEHAHVAAIQQQILNAVPGDHATLAAALREPNVSMQLLALDRLGEMAEWDPEARRLLAAFRHEAGNEGLQRRAADLLSSVSGMPIAPQPRDQDLRDSDGNEPG